MSNDLTTGLIWSSTLPDWQRDYYSLLLLETLRTKSIMVPYTIMKEDYAQGQSGVIIYTDVYDTEPNWNSVSESGIWLSGAALDSRTVRIQLEIHGDILKFSDYNEIVQYVNAGNMRGLVREKIGQNQVDYLDILARNAFLSHPNPTYMGSATSRITLGASDYFDPDMAEVIRVHLEENEVPGVAAVGDGAGSEIVCVTSPRVVKDIRTSGTSKWLEVQEYAGSTRKFNSEVGSWAGIRFVRTNRMRLRNYGEVVTQDTLNGATVVGQGASETVDSVYTVGQSTSTRNIVLDSTTGFAAGQYITIHSVSVGSSGDPPIESDGTQETRRIISVTDGTHLVLDKPLLKPHADGDYVTNGRDLHASVFMGGPGVVYGVGERPQVITPPKYDDLMMVNRYGWRGFVKFQLFRPEFFEVVYSAGSTD